LNDEQIRQTLGMAVGGIYFAGKYIGVKHAEVRVHPDAPGQVGVRIEYEDGSMLWLVAEEN